MADPTPNSARNTDDTGLWRRVGRLTASPLLYVGAVTVVVGTELATGLPLPQFWQAVATLPIALALLYGQLAALVYYRRRFGRNRHD